ncbi:hypothetical protein ABZS66_41045 [Dactylosporangium sp. NPDC005572]|uniref:hypothetical protein n=1 Tax=Dactylosporangium sp. NPDC005572 TaxID=3156889 RepID=UPI0033A2B95E
MQRSRRIVLVTAALLVAAAVTVLGVAYSIGAFTDEGRFGTAPGCGVVDAATVAPVLANPQIAADGDNCTATDGQTQINVGFTVVTKRGNVGGPKLAERFIDAVGGSDTERLKGVGEQAIRQRTNAIGAPQIITMRVSNLIVVLSVANLSGGDLPAGAEDGLVKVAMTLGTRLAKQ